MCVTFDPPAHSPQPRPPPYSMDPIIDYVTQQPGTAHSPRPPQRSAELRLPLHTQFFSNKLFDTSDALSCGLLLCKRAEKVVITGFWAFFRASRLERLEYSDFLGKGGTTVRLFFR